MGRIPSHPAGQAIPLPEGQCQLHTSMNELEEGDNPEGRTLWGEHCGHSLARLPNWKTSGYLGSPCIAKDMDPLLLCLPPTVVVTTHRPCLRPRPGLRRGPATVHVLPILPASLQLATRRVLGHTCTHACLACVFKRSCNSNNVPLLRS